MTIRFDGRVAIVTGAGSGLGRSHALALAVVLCAGAGSFARYVAVETEGIYLAPDERTPETIAARFDEISDPAGGRLLDSALEQTMKFVKRL